MKKQDLTCNGLNDSASRREFFQRAASMLAGVAVSRRSSDNDLLPTFGDTSSPKIKLPPPVTHPGGDVMVNNLPGSRLGKTDLEITKIGFGGMLTKQPNVLLHALDQGINFAHTSPGYQGGESLDSFGKVLKEHRHRVIVAVKERPGMLDRILPSLRTDYVDIVMPPIHSPAALRDNRLIDNFMAAKESGKCRYLGFACHSQMTQVVEKAAEMGIFDVAMVSYMNTDDPFFFRSLRLARVAGMGIIAMKGLPNSSYRANHSDMFELTNTMCSYMLNRWYAHSVMASMDTYQTVDSFGKIMDGHLAWSDDELGQKWLASREVDQCSMCGKCYDTCPQGVDISRVLRYRKYYTDYEQPEYARSRYARLSTKIDPSACKLCSECEKSCNRDLPLRDMLSDAHKLMS